jgi:hypothetical protein
MSQLMKYKHFLVWLAAWMVLGLFVIDHNLAPRGRSTFNWPNPAHSTVSFHWNTAADVIPGRWSNGVWLRPGKTLTFLVRLPRGFQRGTLMVNSDHRTPGLFSVRAESLPNKPLVTKNNSATIRQARLQFSWLDLAAQGKEFTFHLTSLSTEDILIRRLSLSATR